ncbi:ATP-binding protein [Shewanella sp. 4_MG-2023]|uniref:AAA family ATPase n=1 Tax=Shewanella sp. 4_MG-2023 TaxID=3062652 RepID=UPI0026E3A3C9|nr:ATP-binding protein [Shewanella sp. 4_MG-2023]MDO6679346.1 ATP-binding protein [Shewanella sp. 4_MG-2023]
MDIQQTLLLPSQEALVQRLQHIASYSEQLVLVCGAKGSGKTTLVTALASELDNYNSALVICPMHADSAEIRRKILIQLISSPIFDDTLPLSDTLIRIQSSLTKPLHIIIDDAHLLPKELWAECIVLTQIRCADKPVSLTFTVTTESFAEFNELTKTMKDLLLHVEVEPLSLAEREGLYRTLLVRSNKTPFIPREIIQSQIEKQMGTPTEVIELLKLALEDKVEEPKRWPKYFPLGVISLLLCLTLAIVGFFYNEPAAESIEANQVNFRAYQAPESPAQWANHHYGQSLLLPWLQLHLPSQQSLIAANEPSDLVLQLFTEQQILTSTTKSGAVEIEAANTQQDYQSVHTVAVELVAVELVAGELIAAELVVNEDIDTAEVDETLVIIETDKLQLTDNSAALSNTDDIATANEALAELQYRAGYTLQLASVIEPKSLNSILLKLDNETAVIRANYNKRHVVLFGQFNNASQAQDKALKLQTELGLSAPWVRKFSDLQGYQLSSN